MASRPSSASGPDHALAAAESQARREPVASSVKVIHGWRALGEAPPLIMAEAAPPTFRWSFGVASTTEIAVVADVSGPSGNGTDMHDFLDRSAFRSQRRVSGLRGQPRRFAMAGAPNRHPDRVFHRSDSRLRPASYGPAGARVSKVSPREAAPVDVLHPLRLLKLKLRSFAELPQAGIKSKSIFGAGQRALSGAIRLAIIATLNFIGVSIECQ